MSLERTKLGRPTARGQGRPRRAWGFGRPIHAIVRPRGDLGANFPASWTASTSGAPRAGLRLTKPWTAAGFFLGRAFISGGPMVLSFFRGGSW